MVRSIGEIFCFLKKYGNDKPLRRILLSLKRQNREGVIIQIKSYPEAEIEGEMWELESLDETETTRLDFYNVSKSGSEKGDYLGYTLLRPKPSGSETSPQRVGETVIKVPKDKGYLQYFLTCGAEIPIEKDNIITYPFFQQHWLKKWKCGFANLRMFSKWLKYYKGGILNPEEKYKDLIFPQIDNLIVREQSGEFTVNDFKQGLEKMGFYLLTYKYNHPEKKPTISPEQIVYSYIESGIPVFVILRTPEEGHVVTVIGHTFDPDAWWPEAEKEYYARLFGRNYLRSTAWVDFIIHDDNYGSFLTMPKDFLKINFDIYQTPWYMEHLPLKQQEKLKKERDSEIKNSSIWEIIVPFRKDIQIRVEIAEPIAFKAITKFEFWAWRLPENEYITSTNDWRKRLHDHLEKGNIILRTFLIRASELSKTFPDERKKVVEKIFSSDIPELVWLIEISIPELFAHERYRLGEIVIDAMYLYEKVKENYLAPIRYIHLPGAEWWLKNGSVEYAQLLKDDNPYSHLIR